MTTHVRTMPKSQQPLSERYRITAKAWCDHDAAARVLEELKGQALEQHKTDLMKNDPKMSEAKAKRLASISPSWEEYVREMCTARAEANILKCELEAIRIEHREWIGTNADERAERRLHEMHP